MKLHPQLHPRNRMEPHPRTQLLCFFYNEEFLLPYFLAHYWWVDAVHAVVSRSSDSTREVLAARSPWVTVEDFEFPAGMDDFLKRDKVNEWLRQPTDYDWQIVVDADELIWPTNYTADLRWSLRNRLHGVAEYLATVPRSTDVLLARMWNVFRHETDRDLDMKGEPPVLQRRHGDPDRNSAGNAQYQKPIVLRANRGIQLGLGNHELVTASRPPQISATHFFDGAHWQNADPSFAVARRIRDRRDRQSAANRECGLGSQHHFINDADVLALCAAHANDLQCF